MDKEEPRVVTVREAYGDEWHRVFFNQPVPLPASSHTIHPRFNNTPFLTSEHLDLDNMDDLPEDARYFWYAEGENGDGGYIPEHDPLTAYIWGLKAVEEYKEKLRG